MEALMTVMEHLKPHTVFKVGNVPISSTVVNTWIIMAVLFVLVFVLTRGLQLVPRGKQHLIELPILFIWGLLEAALGKKGRKFPPLVGTLFLFILFLNLAWFIPGMKPPTMDLSTTAAFGVTTIITVQLIGIKEKGLGGYIKHFCRRIRSWLHEYYRRAGETGLLSLRLFGNMFEKRWWWSFFLFWCLSSYRSPFSSWGF